MAKCVPVQPSSDARSFILLTKESSEPEMYTAIMLQASLAELSIAQYSRSPRLMVSPICIPAVLPSSIIPCTASFPAVTVSEVDTSPLSTASAASRTVIIFVSEAGSRRSSALYVYSGRPVDSSITMAAAERSSGALSSCSSASAAGVSAPASSSKLSIRENILIFFISISAQMWYHVY